MAASSAHRGARFSPRAGALIVTFSLAPPHGARAGRSGRARRSFPAVSKERRCSMHGFASAADGSITVFTGKAELGQGVKTALIALAAEELACPRRSDHARHRRYEPHAERGLHGGQQLDEGQRHRNPECRGAGARDPDRSRVGEARHPGRSIARATMATSSPTTAGASASAISRDELRDGARTSRSRSSRTRAPTRSSASRLRGSTFRRR